MTWGLLACLRAIDCGLLTTMEETRISWRACWPNVFSKWFLKRRATNQQQSQKATSAKKSAFRSPNHPKLKFLKCKWVFWPIFPNSTKLASSKSNVKKLAPEGLLSSFMNRLGIIAKKIKLTIKRLFDFFNSFLCLLLLIILACLFRGFFISILHWFRMQFGRWKWRRIKSHTHQQIFMELFG